MVARCSMTMSGPCWLHTLGGVERLETKILVYILGEDEPCT